jgi:hypothetical protein
MREPKTAVPVVVGATPPSQFAPSVHAVLVAPVQVWADAGSGRPARHVSSVPTTGQQHQREITEDGLRSMSRNAGEKKKQ